MVREKKEEQARQPGSVKPWEELRWRFLTWGSWCAHSGSELALSWRLYFIAFLCHLRACSCS
jgi:hypothetical protein